MSEKYVLEKYIALINKGFCSDCNELNCIDNYPSKKIASCIDVILKENTNLKQALNEIREYIAKDIQECTYRQVSKYQEILQIIDKALGGSDE